MSSELEIYRSKGLSEVQAKMVAEWVDNGRDGIHKLKADQFAHMYILGYSCEDIAKEFPEYKLPMLLWARVKYGWDELRDTYRENLSRQTLQAVLTAKAESIRFLADIATATHVKHKSEILRYIAAPDREKAPEVIPKTLHQYGQLIQMLTDLTTPPTPKGGPAGATAASSPLVSINVTGSSGTANSTTTIDVTPGDAKEALRQRQELKGKK